MPANLIKIESTPDLVEQVYASLLDAISDGTLPPGARIMQEDIAEQLAVSPSPCCRRYGCCAKMVLCSMPQAEVCWWPRWT